MSTPELSAELNVMGVNSSVEIPRLATMYQLYKLISGLTLLSPLFLLFIFQLNAETNLQFDNLFIQTVLKQKMSDIMLNQ